MSIRTPRAALAALALLAAAAFAPPAFAQAPAPTEDAVRYTMQTVEGGLMRLDTRTGRMTFCSTRAGTWTCELVPEERSAYEDEINRLNERIAALQKGGNVPPGVPDIAKPPLATTPPPAAPPLAAPPLAAEPKAGEGSGATAQNTPDAGDPTGDANARGHIDQAMDMAEHVFRRFLDMVDRLKNQSERL